MPRLYRSAQGQLINLDALYLMNEQSKAVGNMNVNANGDEIDATGNITKPRSERMKDYYNRNQHSATQHVKGKR